MTGPNDRDTRERGVEGLFLAAHTLTRNDPLTIVLRREQLEGMVRRARAAARATGLTVVTREADPYCAEPMCLKRAEKAGRCSAHYQRYRVAWVSQVCDVDGCTNGAVGKGLCGNHAQQAHRADPDRPRCTHPDGCDAPATKRNLCNRHYLAARKAGTLPPLERPTVCTADGCDAPVYAKAMCRPHYRQQSGT